MLEVAPRLLPAVDMIILCFDVTDRVSISVLAFDYCNIFLICIGNLTGH